MPSQASLPLGKALVEQPSLRYLPGWIDQLVDRIDQLPIPPLLLVAGVLSFVWLVINASRWIEGSAPIGASNAPYAFATLYPVAALAAIHYLDRTAGGAFDHFKPALGKSDVEAARLRYELTVVPGREAYVVGLVGLAFTVPTVAVGGYNPLLGSGTFYWTLVLVVGAGFVLTADLLYHTARQLSVVSRIHASAENLDLFHFGPLYSFSGLTARKGLVFALLLWFDIAANPETFNNAALLALNVVVLVVCAACFVWSLYGMHQRLLVEKGRLQWSVDQRVAAIVQHLYAKVDGLDLHDADEIRRPSAA